MSKGVVITLVVVLLGVGGYFVWRAQTAGESQEMINTIVNTPSVSRSVESVSPAVSTGEVKTFTVEGSNFKFMPAEMMVKKGDTVKIVFKNTGGMHDFVVDEFSVQINQINDGEEEEIEFVADKAGTFEYYCSVGQHRQMGMKGKLIVE